MTLHNAPAGGGAPRRARRWLLLAALCALSVGVDQFTKSLALKHVTQQPVDFLGGSLRLQLAMNSGAFLGLAGELPETARFWLLTVLNALFLGVVAGILVVRWNMSPARFFAGSMILSGGMGNLIDRIAQNGQVTDFLNVGVGTLRTGIFNVADMAITLGVCLVACLWWREESRGMARVPAAWQEPVTQPADSRCAASAGLEGAE
jgi:signal peptidase II